MSTGTELRDAGIALVGKSNESWLLSSSTYFYYWLKFVAPEEFTIEDFRMYAAGNGLPEPHHPNAWGALSRRHRTLIKPVGYTQSQRPLAHSRLTRTYQKA
jgi:hypothetical protein